MALYKIQAVQKNNESAVVVGIQDAECTLFVDEFKCLSSRNTIHQEFMFTGIILLLLEIHSIDQSKMFGSQMKGLLGGSRIYRQVSLYD